MKIHLIAAAALLGAAATQAPAATFYKLTDSTGRVTYVDRAPSAYAGKVEVVTVNPDANTARLPDVVPTEAQVEAERIIRSGQTERAAESQAADQGLQTAQANVLAARMALEQAQNNSLAEDWIYFQRGGRAPRPEFAARLEALDANLKQAEAALAAAEQQKRLSY